MTLREYFQPPGPHQLALFGIVPERCAAVTLLLLLSVVFPQRCFSTPLVLRLPPQPRQ